MECWFQDSAEEELTLDGKAGLGLGPVRCRITEVRVIRVALTQSCRRAANEHNTLGPGRLRLNRRPTHGTVSRNSRVGLTHYQRLSNEHCRQ